MAQPYYEIWFRKARWSGGNIDGFLYTYLIKDYNRLEFTINHNNVGGWILEMPDLTEGANLLRAALVGDSPDGKGSEHGYGGITVIRNGHIVFSGPVRAFEATGNFVAKEGPTITFFGNSNEVYLADRLAMVPAPPSSGIPFIPNSTLRYFVSPFLLGWSYYIYPEPGQTRDAVYVLRNIVSDNIGPTAPYKISGNTRRIPFLTTAIATESGIRNVRVRTRYENLLDKCREVASAGGCWFKMLEKNDGTLEFRCGGIGIDPSNPNWRRNTAIFSPALGNVASYRDHVESPKTTHIVCGAQGDYNVTFNSNDQINGAARWFFHRNLQQDQRNLNNIYGLRETFLDRRDVKYEGTISSTPGQPGYQKYLEMREEVLASMDNHLLENGEHFAIELEVIDKSPTRFFDDYNVSNLVTVILHKTEIPAQVSSVNVTLTRDEGEVIKPTLSITNTLSKNSLFKNISDMRRAIATLNTGL